MCIISITTAQFINLLQQLTSAERNKLTQFATQIETNAYTLKYIDNSGDGWMSEATNATSTTIYYDLLKQNVNYVAHEYFHALFFKNGFPTPQVINQRIIQHSRLKNQFSLKDPGLFINNLMHYKFFPHYKKAKYDERCFVYNDVKLLDLKDVKAHKSELNRSEGGVYKFLCIFIVTQCIWIPDYKIEYRKIRTLLFLKDPILFVILLNLFICERFRKNDEIENLIKKTVKRIDNHIKN